MTAGTMIDVQTPAAPSHRLGACIRHLAGFAGPRRFSITGGRMGTLHHVLRIGERIEEVIPRAITLGDTSGPRCRNVT